MPNIAKNIKTKYDVGSSIHSKDSGNLEIVF